MNTKTRMLLLITATFTLSLVAVIFAATGRQPGEKMWTTISERSVDRGAKRLFVPMAYRTVRLDKASLTALLASAPMEFTRQVSENPIIELPMPDGTLARFHFEESPVVEPGLAAQYPGLKTYRAQGIDDPTASARFDWLPSGFHGIILAPSGTVLIDPYLEGNNADYISYWKKDAANVMQPFECHLDELNLPQPFKPIGVTPNVVTDSKLRTYRLAVAATHEYAVLAGGDTIAGTLNAEVVVINRINAIYEREVSVHMNIISNNAAITYASDHLCGLVPCNNENDPYTNGDCGVMLGENHTNLPLVIGAANYDIGHVFNTCNGGRAYLSSVCGEFKEGGSTGHAAPIDPISTSYVAHEIGHQFSANHSFNGIGVSCSEETRSASSAYEVGSGITFMSYVGGCPPQNLAGPNDFLDIFTVKGLEDVIGFSQSLDSTCGAVTNNGNAPPTVSGPGNFTIPKQTPFSLNATSFERGITYDWEEYDLGPAATTIPNSDADGNARPILRLYAPTVKGTRYFPSLEFVLNNANVPPTCIPECVHGYLTGELLPAISRTMVFKAVARDNQAGGGGINTVQSSITIDGNAAPFAITSPDGPVSIPRLTNYNVTWVPSGNAANVKISLSTDGGNTFPTVLAASTPNDGAQSVFIPNVVTSTGRIKIEAVGNIYFDISTNFSIYIGDS